MFDILQRLNKYYLLSHVITTGRYFMLESLLEGGWEYVNSYLD